MRLVLVTVFFACLFGCHSIQAPSPTEILTDLNEQMETYYRAGKGLELAAMYYDEGHLLGPGKYHVTGREAIDEYWTKITDPVDWQLEVLAVSDNETDIFQSPVWESFADKPPHWQEYGIRIPQEADVLYQLGRSTLQYKREGKVQTSVVDFVLVWMREGEEPYKILIDTYH